MATETRSHNGWLECHGFGEKPEWMDRGARQKAQATKMKQKVAQAMKTRRMSHIRGQPESLMKRLSESNTTEPVPSCTTNSAPSIPASTHRSIMPQTHGCNDPALLLQPDVHRLSPYDQSNFDSEYQSTFDEMIFLSSPTFELPDIPAFSAENVYPTHSPAIIGELNDRSTGYPIFQNQTDRHISTSGTTSIQMLPITSIEDAVLLAHFMDKTLNWQFRFCWSDGSGFNRGYFIWLMSKSRPLYMASLALSSLHRNLNKTSGLPQPNLRSDDHMDRYDKATEEFRRHYKTQKPADDVALLACIASFISSSFLHSDKIDWNDYLDVGISLVTQWIAQQPTEVDPKLHKSPEDSSRDFFIGSIIRFHILSAITREAPPSLTDSYRKLFKSGSSPVFLEGVSGCENWVFDHLLGVYLLRDWKRRTRIAGLLSLWELTSKATAIKNDLERRIASNVKDIEVLRKEHMQVQQRSRYDICVTTHIFACAVSILLEVIVSGAYPQLPEIKQKVERALESFTYVGDPDLLGELRWPILVVGCVVEVEQYELIRHLVLSSQMIHSAGMSDLGGLLEGCWKSRETGEVKDDTFDFSHLRSQRTEDVLVA
ncbi:hypothetical protein DL764_010056 [Monosporascus ibericus]|uniref:Transcription factor domain-containing protein n=1 Tax=Monosporascus ibericus TaxID=155417 RepID=A0A4Q4SVC3_9PEZI|nr:hypothetical protein DL764_010056 [Monosporascus ibericus]